MACASPVTSRYFLVKWIYITGERVKNFEVDKLWSFGSDEEDIRLNDNVSSYLRDEDAEVFGKLVAHDKIKIWVKTISDPIEKDKNYYQACFMSVTVVKIFELLCGRHEQKGHLCTTGTSTLYREKFTKNHYKKACCDFFSQYRHKFVMTRGSNCCNISL